MKENKRDSIVKELCKKDRLSNIWNICSVSITTTTAMTTTATMDDNNTPAAVINRK